ncbi:structural maintenance of chromosomes protein 6A [Arabidopsis lyrata subsp. lyrata]|uniref:structural maintenance of chromosomes protein 6A n=1 Tax=Arabidopsis lyrata subsp. lyrata TaxID=81972 RepID=UPI000A29AD68|nr:structural maintenance of chromosomes protein 6A [Arabidopsis lyrata subsp. lyrata]|eukprot:XP_020877425.1 structural maintenance of chromosomes protein 6A [Arabidopsis lyrata subsp. lyrata]
MDEHGNQQSNPFNDQRPSSGTIVRIRLENFMCHSNLEIEFGDWVNFITGQNGSGKSAILTALCVAFGCRARGTQRAATLKDFIKNGCSYALVHVELKNQGEDAFKPEIYGDTLIIERRISDSTSLTVLKDHQGRKISSRREELRQLVEHYNIDVENPCVIMSQDKSREFLHSGNDKDKFKFFYKATLLQQVDDLLQSIGTKLKSANALMDEMEKTIKPIQKEISELLEKIKNMEHVEEITQQVLHLKNKLAWSWVYDVNRQLKEQNEKIVKLRERVPTCQNKIDRKLGEVESLRVSLTEKKAQVACLIDESTAMKRELECLRQSMKKAAREKIALEEEYHHKCNNIQKIKDRVRRLERQIGDINEMTIRSTQVEQSEIEEKLKKLMLEVEKAESLLSSLKEEENMVIEKASAGGKEKEHIEHMIRDHEKKQRNINAHINDLKKHQTNKVTAFGGDRVINLLRAIERHHRRFKMPPIGPIGPIGAHVTLINGNRWASAVEQALGNLLNAFIVNDHKDLVTLRDCGKEANYNNLKIIIYDFSRPRLTIPRHMIPQTEHPTILSVLHSENTTVLNVLVDVSGVERRVLAENYEVGKTIAFERRLSHLNDVFTIDGYRMFSRGPVQTTLPPRSRRPTRLCASFDDQIKDLEIEASKEQSEIQECRGQKREAEMNLEGLESTMRRLKKQRTQLEKDLTRKEIEMQDLKNSVASETKVSPTSGVNELHLDIMKFQEEIEEKESLLEKLQDSLKEAELKANELKASYEKLYVSQGEIEALEKAEDELKEKEEELQSAETEKNHYEDIMKDKVLPEIKQAEAKYEELKTTRQESNEKASIICPESTIRALGPWDGATPLQLSAQINKINHRLKRENEKYSESIDDLRIMHEEKEQKIGKKRKTYKSFREKLKACKDAVDLRWNKLQRNKDLLKPQLTWQFNSHLGKKGISGNIRVSYEDKTLSIEVKMPQDATNSAVRDTRGLSGGERSFSTLCFTLALHNMTEAPIRAMDEFDVFMDAVSRKISLDTLVDFALEQGSQWMFITPHDISMVKSHEKIKKQQMAAPRS